MGTDDRRAIGVLLVVAAAGLVVRFGPLTTRRTPPGEVAFRARSQRPERDSVAARAARLARPLARGERVDVDRASAEELARMPRIGPGLAARIVEDRESKGPFGSLEGLDRVSGVGAGLLQAIKPYASFSGLPRPPSGPALPSAGPPVRRGGGVEGKGSVPVVRLNTATVAELAQLPGIGPTRAAAIVADRKARGPYRRPEDLQRVPGIGPATVARLKGRVRVP
ncbi:MAG TPA: helix-hairpin-helix domain-containing protein [Gemmatimonadales bacterium]